MRGIYFSFTLTCLSLLLWIMPQQTQAQQHTELGAFLGTTTYFGDLNHNFNVDYTRPAGGLIYRYHLFPYIMLKATAGIGWLAHDDASVDLPFQQARNLNFKTPIIEASGQLELHFKSYEPGGRNIKNYSTPYLTAGIALVHFNPKTELNGQTYQLNEVGTEGQNNASFSGNDAYKLIQPAIPVGIGYKSFIQGKWTFYVEATYRQTFTDYLDDVSGEYLDHLILGTAEAVALSDRSGEVLDEPIGLPGYQRGDRIGKDGYFMTQVGITYLLFNKKCAKPN